MQVNPDLKWIDEAIASFARRPHPIPLFCGVQHYAWGDRKFIPRLLGIPNPQRKPFAELWIGAHPDLPAQAVMGHIRVPLDRLLLELPEALLGKEVVVKHQGRLPFLMKILAAAQPLSIQVHPNKRQAEEGYAREDKLGIPLSSPQRNYRDRNHKPELLCALTPFYALKGFRPEEEIEGQLATIPEWPELLDRFHRDGLRDFYHHLMTLSQDQVDALLSPLLARLRRQGGFSQDQREHWLLRADELYAQTGHHDRGLFSILLLNFLCLRPGEAIFQAAGEPHAYLQGVGVEIMGNSNNVLRGGLTPKHVDVAALLEIVNFHGERAKVLLPMQRGPETLYETPAEEFCLSRIELAPGKVYVSSGSVRLGIVLEGAVDLSWEGGVMRLRRGQSYLIPYGFTCCFRSRDCTVIYQGTCP